MGNPRSPDHDDSTSPLSHLFPCTPSDVADLPNVARALHVGVSGALRVTTIGGEEVTLTVVQPGWFPVRIAKVWATGTTATGIHYGW